MRPNNGHSYGGGPSSSSHAGPPSDEATFAASDNLTFDGSSFESANLASARLVNVNPNEYDLAIRSDTLNERHKVWFYFSVRGARAGQKAILNLVGYSKTKSLFREGMAPVVCSTGRPYWERMPANSIYYYRSPRHERQYVLSFPFCFERADETYFFAYCFPYTYSYLQRFLFALESKALPHFHRELLCRTLQERRCDLVTISSPANLKLDAAIRRGETPSTNGQQKHVVFISSRVHPGETPASFMMHGLLLFLTSDHPRARALREAVIIQVVPMLNPDGVFLGNYRCNSVGLDLNRQWHASIAGTAPTISAMRECARQYIEHSEQFKLEMVLDMHAHSTCMNGFIFANMPENPKDIDEVAAFPRVLGLHCKDFSSSGCKFDTDPNKMGTGRRALSEILPNVHCYTLEVSMFCGAVGNVRGEPYLPATYTEFGQAVGLALHEHFCTGKNGVLNGSVSASSTAAAAIAQPPQQRAAAAIRQAQARGLAASVAPPPSASGGLVATGSGWVVGGSKAGVTAEAGGGCNNGRPMSGGGCVSRSLSAEAARPQQAPQYGDRIAASNGNGHSSSQQPPSVMRPNGHPAAATGPQYGGAFHSRHERGSNGSGGGGGMRAHEFHVESAHAARVAKEEAFGTAGGQHASRPPMNRPAWSAGGRAAGRGDALLKPSSGRGGGSMPPQHHPEWSRRIAGPGRLASHNSNSTQPTLTADVVANVRRAKPGGPSLAEQAGWD